MRSSNLQFRKKIFNLLNTIRGINNARIMVSVSGGPDSTALLHFLSSLSSQFNFKLFAFYLDHGIRPENEISGEIALLKNFCNSLNVEFYCEHLAAGELKITASRKGCGMEMAARERRYQLLEKYAAQLNCDFMALGHTLDDNIETILMRFFQGCNYSGLKGIPVKRGKIIRPFAYCTKKEVLDYLAENALSYSIDSTNLTNTYLRNKIRNQLIPVIAGIFPGFGKSMLNFSRKMGYIKEFINTEEKKQIKIHPYKDGYRVLIHEFKALPAALKISLVFGIYNKITSRSERKLPFRFIKPLINHNFTAKILLKGYGLEILKKDNYLFFHSDIVSNRKKGYLVVNEDFKSNTVRNNYFAFKIIGDEVENTKYTDYSDALILKRDLIKLPLIIRTRKKGDTINFRTFTKTLKKLFNEWKVPEESREMLPLVTDRSGIIGIMGKSFGYKNIVRYEHNEIEKEEKIIKIQISSNLKSTFLEECKTV